MTASHESGHVERLLARWDDHNQSTLAALSPHVQADGPGIVFLVSPCFTDNEWREFAPRVHVDGAAGRRVPFGSSFMALEPGRRAVRVENGGAVIGHRHGIDLLVDVPPDRPVTLHVKAGLMFSAPTVTPDADADGAVWVHSSGPGPHENTQQG